MSVRDAKYSVVDAGLPAAALKHDGAWRRACRKDALTDAGAPGMISNCPTVYNKVNV